MPFDLPKHMQIVKEIYGDLNKDSIEEKNLICNNLDQNDKNLGYNRHLFVLKKKMTMADMLN